MYGLQNMVCKCVRIQLIITDPGASVPYARTMMRPGSLAAAVVCAVMGLGPPSMLQRLQPQS